MAKGSLAALAHLLGSPLLGSGPTEFTDISTDTRNIQPGSVFIALRGEHFDGHDFVPAAFNKGAAAAIVEQPVTADRQLLVPDTLAALQQIARWWRSQFAIPIIAITGSAGKTSTKEMLAAALSRYGTVLKSPANHNNDIGVAQTVLDLAPTHQFAVIEMAMRGPGEIARLAQTAWPTHALITNIGTAHIGRLGSRQAIAQAKCEILAQDPNLVPILNAEDALLLQAAAQVWVGSPVTYGLEGGSVRGDWDPLSQAVVVAGIRLPVPLPGRHQALNWMAVVATLQSLGLDLGRLQDPLALPPNLTGRNQVLQLPGDIWILDETYNAAPEAMIAALRLLAQTPGQRHWAILGPMRELGDFAADLYAEVGSVAAGLDLHRVVLLDPEGEMDPFAYQIAPEQVVRCTTVAQVVRDLLAQVRPGDRLLFKAARAIALEQVLQQFCQSWNTAS